MNLLSAEPMGYLRCKCESWENSMDRRNESGNVGARKTEQAHKNFITTTSASEVFPSPCSLASLLPYDQITCR